MKKAFKKIEKTILRQMNIKSGISIMDCLKDLSMLYQIIDISSRVKERNTKK